MQRTRSRAGAYDDETVRDTAGELQWRVAPADAMIQRYFTNTLLDTPHGQT